LRPINQQWIIKVRALNQSTVNQLNSESADFMRMFNNESTQIRMFNNESTQIMHTINSESPQSVRSINQQ
jgi:hypothetical protein